MEHSRKINRKILKKEMKTIFTVLLCCAFVMAILPFSELALGQTPSTAVSGSVTNSTGVGLSGAEVELRATTGALITSAVTDSSGNYVLANVAFGTYSLQIGKQGYVDVVQAILVNVDGQQLGATVLPSALSLSASTLGFAVSPGNQIQIPITLTYSGEGRETVDLSASVPVGWTTRITQGTYEVNRISLPSGQGAQLQLEVTLPSTVTYGVTYNFSFIATGQTSAFLNFTATVGNQTSGTISGRLVDEKNVGLGSVKVDVTTMAGASVTSVWSNADGTFSVSVSVPDAYRLVFSKGGYIEVETIMFLSTSNPNVVTGDILLTRTIWLTSSIISVAVNPGDTLVLPFTVSNMGTDIEPVSFAAAAPSGWQAKVLDGSKFQVETLALSPSGSTSLSLEVKVPLGTKGNYSLSVSAIGNITTTLNFNAKVGLPTGALLSCSYPGKSSTPGESVKFQVKLANPFNVEMRFNLLVENLPANWTAVVKSAAGDFVTEFVLGPKEVADLVVDAKSFSSEVTDVPFTFALKAEAVGQNLTDVLPLTATLSELANEITMTARMPEKAIEAGQHVDYNVAVANLGADDRTLLLTAAPPTNWKIIFKLEGSEITRFHLYGGNTSDLIIQLIPPSTVQLGTYVTTFQVKSPSGTVLAETNLTTTVTGSYNLNLQLSAYQVAANSGESTTFTANIFNAGYTTVTGVVVNVTRPEDSWEVSVSPVKIESIRPQESASFSITVKTGQNTVAGDYMVSVTAKSDQVESQNQNQVRIVVSASTSWGVWGIGIAIGFVVLLVLVFWKFKRR